MKKQDKIFMRKLINNTHKSPNKKSDFNALRQNGKIFFLGKISVILLETSGFFAKILNINKLKTLYNNDFQTQHGKPATKHRQSFLAQTPSNNTANNTPNRQHSTTQKPHGKFKDRTPRTTPHN